MSFYRKIVTGMAVLGVATSVFAADDVVATAAQNPAENPQMLQVADASSSTSSTNTEQAVETKIDVNKATAKELSKIKGLNGTRAKAIVSYRKKHGNFKSLDDLRQVKGFKKMKDDQFKSIQDQLMIG